VEEFVLLRLLAVIFHTCTPLPPEVQQLFARCVRHQHAHTCEAGKQGYQPSVPEVWQLIWIFKPTTPPLVLELGEEWQVHAVLPFLTPYGNRW